MSGYPEGLSADVPAPILSVLARLRIRLPNRRYLSSYVPRIAEIGAC